jgi:hypothetical protein
MIYQLPAMKISNSHLDVGLSTFLPIITMAESAFVS